jgi:hypothetical protein
VQLNGDRRIPMDIRRKATHIARHFPIVGDVTSASLLGDLAKDDSLIEHRRNCKGCERRTIRAAAPPPLSIANFLAVRSCISLLADRLGQSTGMSWQYRQ